MKKYLTTKFSRKSLSLFAGVGSFLLLLIIVGAYFIYSSLPGVVHAKAQANISKFNSREFNYLYQSDSSQKDISTTTYKSIDLQSKVKVNPETTLVSEGKLENNNELADEITMIINLDTQYLNYKQLRDETLIIEPETAKWIQTSTQLIEQDSYLQNTETNIDEIYQATLPLYASRWEKLLSFYQQSSYVEKSKAGYIYKLAINPDNIKQILPHVLPSTTYIDMEASLESKSGELVFTVSRGGKKITGILLNLEDYSYVSASNVNQQSVDNSLRIEVTDINYDKDASFEVPEVKEVYSYNEFISYSTLIIGNPQAKVSMSFHSFYEFYSNDKNLYEAYVKIYEKYVSPGLVKIYPEVMPIYRYSYEKFEFQNDTPFEAFLCAYEQGVDQGSAMHKAYINYALERMRSRKYKDLGIAEYTTFNEGFAIPMDMKQFIACYDSEKYENIVEELMKENQSNKVFYGYVTISSEDGYSQEIKNQRELTADNLITQIELAFQ